jgi:threonine dehydratase
VQTPLSSEHSLPNTAAEPAAPTAADVYRAQARIGRILAPTPVVFSPSRRAHLKLENLQATGAYKVRGALNAAIAQIERGDRRPLVAASAGNHAQGVAWAADRLGLRACVVVPQGAPESKCGGARALGAQVVVGGASFEQCVESAHAIARARGFHFVHAFDDPDVIAGQGTVGLELLALAPDVVIVPIGGGGLAAGVGLALHDRGVRVVGAQLSGIDAMRRALCGEAMSDVLPATIADGVRVRVAGEITTSICARVLDDIVVVSEEEVRAAIVDLAARDKVVAEGAGAVAVAALGHVRSSRAVAIVSGGNIDLHLLAQLVTRTAA